MKKGKLVLIIAAVLALAIAGSVVYVLTNIDHLVKEAIQKYGSQATKTAVRVSSVNIKLSSGEASIAGLTVANPRGFAFENIFSLGSIAVAINPKTVASTPIVIQDIHIAGPQVFYEMNSAGVSNLDELTRNLQGPPQKPPQKKGKADVKLIVRKLVFENGRVEARIAALGDRPIMLDLPRLEMNNIGGSEGATPDRIATIVATALAEQTAKAVARTQGEKYLKKGAERLMKRYLGQ